MREVEKSGKTVEEAIEAALAELGVSKQQVDVEVLVEPAKGFLGLIGNKLAKVRVTVRESKGEISNGQPEVKLEAKQPSALKNTVAKEEALSRVQVFLQDMFAAMKMDVQLEIAEKEEAIAINVIGSDLGILIGRRGDTLDAIQYLVNLVGNKNIDKRIRFVLDVEGYRSRREQTLQKLAIRLAEKARRNGHEIVLEPMNPHERRVIHTTLQNNRYVYTSSQGDEPYRKIVITPKR